MTGPARTTDTTPPLDRETIGAFGPHLAYAHERPARHRRRADRLVKTHCCFCGQQCGIQLKVKDNAVIGFEPWDDFPFNRACSAPRASSAICRGPSRSPASRLREGRRRARRLSPDGVRRGDPSARRGQIERIQRDARARRLRRALRREPDHREDLPDGQVRPHVPAHVEHRLQRPAVHGERRRPATRRPSASIAPPTRGPTSSAPRWSGSAAPTSPSARRSPRTTSGRRASTARRSSSSIRASRRSRAPATCSCRSSRAATPRSSTASCT